MKPTVYLETSIISYLAAWPSRDLIIAANQQLTHEWWERRRDEYELRVSRAVLEESAAGDPDAAQRRLRLLETVPALLITDAADVLAETLVNDVPLPVRAAVDALHVALATVNGLDYLLTWNLAHIANAAVRGRIESVCRERGYDPPTICTPQEFLES